MNVKALGIYLVLLFILINFTGCQNSDGPRPIKSKICQPKNSDWGSEENTKDYQIGNEWNRTLMDSPLHLPLQVMQMYRTGLGEVGTGIYLGKFGNKHIAMTVSHIFQDLISCKDEVNFLVKFQDTRFLVECADWHYKFKDLDLMLFALRSDDPNNLELLKPVTFDTNHNAGEALNLISIEKQKDFSFRWFIDDSKDCTLLSSQAKLLIDPDCNTEEKQKLSSWSLPMGCDGKHGDSGSPVYNKDLKLKGLLWTGRYPKQKWDTQLLFDDLNTQSENIWQNYNYIVPISALEKEIDTTVKHTVHLKDSTRLILDEISKKIKADREL